MAIKCHVSLGAHQGRQRHLRRIFPRQAEQRTDQGCCGLVRGPSHPRSPEGHFPTA